MLFMTLALLVGLAVLGACEPTPAPSPQPNPHPAPTDPRKADAGTATEPDVLT